MEINNNIQEQSVSFEVAKLLKEAEFECEVVSYYFKDNPTIYGNKYNWNKKYNYETYQYSAPTQQLAIDWIRVNFGVHIETIQELPTYCCYVKNKRYDKFKVQKVTENFNTPEEAKEKALEYCLTTLILKK